VKTAIDWVERGLVPDWITRAGIRKLLRDRLREQAVGDAEVRQMELVRELRQSPIAIETDMANQQHYEVPPAFFDLVLGPNRKYSCGYWPEGVHDLGQAEEAMLALTCERAGLTDGMDILELGCGWGSLTLWMARHYPNSRIVALSNSGPQIETIRDRALAEGYGNVTALVADVNAFSTDQRFDRVVSVEMFEHMRNYQSLMTRIGGWLRPTGKLFVHIFTHRHYSYPFETEGEDNWMGRHFFTGGLMPSEELLSYFQDDLRLVSQWTVDGRHYQRTCEAWLAELDLQRPRAEQVLAGAYGNDAQRWVRRWRVFFMACGELFGFDNGRQWQVNHYLFDRAGA
jgi:cyclopropane-fatty-acyl-phospholipid synthase